MTPFERAWMFLQRPDIEGGSKITADPDDPGGLTKWGISQRAYPNLDIAELKEDDAKALFRRDYWEKCSCTSMPGIVGIALADSAFNQGPKTAIRLLQEALRVDPDGIIGPATLAALHRKTPNDVLNEFLSRRATRYADGNAKYRRGWFLRLFKLKDALSAV